MNKYYFTPGPSQLYPSVSGHIEQAVKEDILAISHRSAQFQEIYKTAVSGLKQLMEIPEDYSVYFMGSATEAMERIIESCVAENSFHFVDGAFAEKFYQAAKDLGRNVQRVDAPSGHGFNIPRIINDENLVSAEVELICLTQSETTTGIAIPPEDIDALHRAYPNKLIAVDTVSSAPIVKLNFKSCDLVFFSVQKAFGLPAGLGVLIASPRAVAKNAELLKAGKVQDTYHSLVSFEKEYVNNQTPETPNVLGIYLLGKVCADMLDEGIDNIRKRISSRHEYLNDKLRAKKLSFNVSEPEYRSSTVSVVDTPDGSAQVIEKLKKQGLIIATGYRLQKDAQIRIANFPAIPDAVFKTMVDSL